MIAAAKQRQGKLARSPLPCGIRPDHACPTCTWSATRNRTSRVITTRSPNSACSRPPGSASISPHAACVSRARSPAASRGNPARSRPCCGTCRPRRSPTVDPGFNEYDAASVLGAFHCGDEVALRATGDRRGYFTAVRDALHAWSRHDGAREGLESWRDFGQSRDGRCRRGLRRARAVRCGSSGDVRRRDRSAGRRCAGRRSGRRDPAQPADPQHGRHRDGARPLGTARRRVQCSTAPRATRPRARGHALLRERVPRSADQACRTSDARLRTSIVPAFCSICSR